MKSRLGIGRHPSRHALFAYAESQATPHAPVSADIAAHLAQCPDCAREARAIQESLTFLAHAEPLEVSKDLTANVLLAARAEARRRREGRRVGAMAWLAVRGLGYAASLAVVAAVAFSAVLADEEPHPADTLAAVGVEAPEAVASMDAPGVRVEAAAADAPSPEAIRKAASEVRALSAAVRAAADGAETPEALERRRAVNAMDADIAAALEALERNPGCVRATHIVHATLQRQAETLRTLYVERAH